MQILNNADEAIPGVVHGLTEEEAHAGLEEFPESKAKIHPRSCEKLQQTLLNLSLPPCTCLACLTCLT